MKYCMNCGHDVFTGHRNIEWETLYIEFTKRCDKCQTTYLINHTVNLTDMQIKIINTDKKEK